MLLAAPSKAQSTKSKAPEAVAQSAPQTGAAPASAGRPIPKISAQEWVVIASVVSAPLILVMLWAGNVIRPGSLGSGRSVNGHPWWVWLFAAMVVWMSLQAGSGAIASRPELVGTDTKALRFTGATQLAGYGLGLISALAMARLLSAGAGGGAGLSLRPKDLPVGLGCLLLAYPILDVISRGAVLLASKIQGQAPDTLAHPVLVRLVENKGSGWAWVVGLCAVLGAPIVEEVIYRGFLQSAVLRIVGKPWPAIFITSAAFAAAHIGAVPYHALGILFFLGVGMGLAYERTKSLGVPIVMHVGFNAANVALAMWLH